jgi:arsenate reductase
MDKKILIMCTGNSCRSIIAEALINKELKGIKAYSCGVAPSGKVNPHAKKILEQHRAWNDNYHSKHLDEVIDIDFDLIITVCEHAKETCPIFPKQTKTIHIGFDDPDGKEFSAFEETYTLIQSKLLGKIKEIFQI